MITIDRKSRSRCTGNDDHLGPEIAITFDRNAHLDERYETDRYHLENWSGPQAIRAQLLADLEQSHRANRERFEACLEELRLSARAHIEEMRRSREHLEPTPVLRTMH